MLRTKKKRGAIFFTVDTLIGGLVLTVTVIALLSLQVQKPVSEDTKRALDNLVFFVTNTDMEEIYNNHRFLYNDVFEPHPDFMAYQKIGYFIDADMNETARHFLQNITEVIVPKQFDVLYYYNDELVYNRTTIDPRYVKTNISSTFITHYRLNETTLIGPHMTRITVIS